MKLSMKHVLLLSAVALASGPYVVLAEEAAAATADDAAADAAAESEPPDAVDASDGDAGEECAADDGGGCASEESEPAAEEPEPAALAAEPVEAKEEEEEDPKCPSRPHVIRCAAKYLDANRNGALERGELNDAIGGVSWLLRGLLRVIGSVDAIMKKCDADGDGKITIEDDMAATEETCLASCFKRKAFKSLFFPDCTE